MAKTQRGLTRNLLVLGSLTLLTLGGLGAFIASRNRGNTHLTEQKVTNEIIQNSYFTRLIASGATTEKDLDAVTGIRPYGEGFIGISKEPLAYAQAGALAKRTGAEILDVEAATLGSRQELQEWIGSSYPESSKSTLWVSAHGVARILDGSDILVVPALDRQRNVILQWGLPKQVPDAESTTPALLADAVPTTEIKADEHRDEAIAAIKQLGGTYSEGPSPGNPIVSVSLPSTKADYRSLRKLQGLHNLAYLDLNGCQIGKAGLEEVGKMRNLETLLLWGAGPITDEGFEHLSKLTNITTLNIGYTGIDTITGAGLSNLRELKNLRFLCLNILTKMRDDNLVHLKNHPELTYLGLGGCTGITDESIKFIAACPKINHLEIHATQITDKGLEELQKLGELQTIHLGETRVTTAGVAKLQRALPGLKIIR